MLGAEEVVERACQVRPHSDYARPTGPNKRRGPPLAIRVPLSNYLQLPGCSLQQFPLFDWAEALLEISSAEATVSTNTPRASAAISRLMDPSLRDPALFVEKRTRRMVRSCCFT